MTYQEQHTQMEQKTKFWPCPKTFVGSKEGNIDGGTERDIPPLIEISSVHPI